MPELELRPETDRVDALEALMATKPPLDIPVRHYFANGLYAREVVIPRDAVVTGKIHKTQHLNIVSAGEISVWTGLEGWKRVKAPCTFIAEPGTRRVGYAHEDTVWTTIHATSETDLDALEAALIEPHDNPLLAPPIAMEAVCPG